MKCGSVADLTPKARRRGGSKMGFLEETMVFYGFSMVFLWFLLGIFGGFPGFVFLVIFYFWPYYLRPFREYVLVFLGFLSKSKCKRSVLSGWAKKRCENTYHCSNVIDFLEMFGCYTWALHGF